MFCFVPILAEQAYFYAISLLQKKKCLPEKNVHGNNVTEERLVYPNERHERV